MLENFSEDKYNLMKKDYHAFSGINKYMSRLTGFWEIYNRDFRFGFGGDTRITPPPGRIRKITDLLFLLPMFVFMIPGALFSLRNKNLFMMIVSVLILSHLFLHTLIAYMPRYRLTIVPLFFMLGGYGFFSTVHLISVIRTK